jgi:hypothetical protein
MDTLQESLDVDRFCGDSEAAVDTCGGYYTALAYYVSFFFLGGYCLLALFTAVRPGRGRVAASEIEVPNLLVNLV